MADIEQQARELPPLPEAADWSSFYNARFDVFQQPVYTAEQMRDYALAALASQPQAPAAVVPDGFVLVPVQPTGDMLDAMLAPWFEDRGHREALEAGYAAAIAAAPAPEVAP